MAQDSERRRTSLVGIVLLGMVGMVWLGQGVGLIPGSVMSGDPKWAVIGGALVVISIALAVRARR